MKARDPKVAMLRVVPALARRPDKQLGQLSPMMDEVSMPAGTVLTREGTPGGETFIIIDGHAEVSLRGETIGRVGPGEFVGEMAMIDHSPRAATVRAVTELHVLALEPASFAAALNDPGFLRQLLTDLARRLRAFQSSPSYDGPSELARVEGADR